MAAPDTSGTVARTTLLVDDVIARAAKRAMFDSGEINNELAEVGRQNIYLLLSELANHGITLWTQRPTLLGTVPGKLQYDLPGGTVDISNALYRTVTKPSSGSPGSSPGGNAGNAFDYSGNVALACTQSGPDGNISYDFGSAANIPVVGIMPNGAATLDLVWESSSDGVTWASFYEPGSADYPDLQMTWADVNPAPSAQYFRVREQGGATLNIRSVIFGQNPNDIPMSRMNRDDYTSFPNKTQAGSPALQYFVQRLQNFPQMLVWTVPDNYYDALLVWNFRQIEDVGDLTNTLEVPQRWELAVIARLAQHIADEYPKKVPMEERVALKARADLLVNDAQGEERDNSPEYLTPNISCYTA